METFGLVSEEILEQRKSFLWALEYGTDSWERSEKCRKFASRKKLQLDGEEERKKRKWLVERKKKKVLLLVGFLWLFLEDAEARLVAAQWHRPQQGPAFGVAVDQPQKEQQVVAWNGCFPEWVRPVVSWKSEDHRWESGEVNWPASDCSLCCRT